MLMKIHEYQGKEILRKYNVPVPRGKVAFTVDEAVSAAEELGTDVDDVEKMLRKMKCEPCAGSDSKLECHVRKDFGCPPGKESKKKRWTEEDEKTSGKPKKKKK